MKARESMLCLTVSCCAAIASLALGAAAAQAALPAKPSISGEVVSKLGSAGATVSATIETGGVEASYRVQYGTTNAYGSESVATLLSPGTQTVSVALVGLRPNTQYHFTFLASNQEGSTAGGDVSFTTYPPEHGLPDNRVYEMVTPPENHNGEVYELNVGLHFTYFPFQASVNGDAVVYVGTPAEGGNGSSGGGNVGNLYLATRGAQGGWTQVNVTPGGSELSTGYQGFAPNLSAGFLGASAKAPFEVTDSLAEPGVEPNVFNGLYFHAFGESSYHPLFTAKPPYRTKGGRYGSFESWPYRFISPGNPAYAGASEDLSVQLFEANDDLLQGEGQLEKELDSDVKTELVELEEAERLKEEGKKEEAEILDGLGDRNELYASTDGHVSLVNVLPDGRLAAGATFGGQPHGAITDSTAAATPEPDFSHDISSDGSRIFWSTVERRGAEMIPGIVYVRESGTSTVQVSEGPALFWTATPDGRYAFYTESGKLWRFDVENQTRVELAGAEGGMQGVVGINETGQDGAYVYFASHEVLTSAENAAKQQAVAGQENLYVELGDPTSPDGATIAFIGTVTPADSGDWVAEAGQAGDWSSFAGERTANVTPDGHALVFTSHNNLTDAPYPDEGSEEVYVYDTRDRSLFCASCRPQASEGFMSTSFSLVHEYRRISEDGDAVFFNSRQPLVAQDVNGAQDVYEWERDGHGDCHESEGCVYLLSGGRESSAYLVDASESGDDVFIVTRQRLTPEDGNEDTDLYDVRVDGARPVIAPQCTGTGCQGTPAPVPIFATPSSVTFNGVGNLPPAAEPAGKAKPRASTRVQKLARALAACHRMHLLKRRRACETRARERYGATAKKASTRGAK